jgi:hypothetical protein
MTTVPAATRPARAIRLNHMPWVKAAQLASTRPRPASPYCSATASALATAPSGGLPRGSGQRRGRRADGVGVGGRKNAAGQRDAECGADLTGRVVARGRDAVLVRRHVVGDRARGGRRDDTGPATHHAHRDGEYRIAAVRSEPAEQHDAGHDGGEPDAGWRPQSELLREGSRGHRQ